MRFHSEPQIHDSKFKIQNDGIGPQPAEDTHDCKELRASAPGKLWHAAPFQAQIQNSKLPFGPRFAK